LEIEFLGLPMEMQFMIVSVRMVTIRKLLRKRLTNILIFCCKGTYGL